MEATLFRFVWRHSWRAQLGVLGLTAVSMPLVYAALELPKRIVDDVIVGDAFPQRFLGLEWAQIPLLMLLCGLFLAAVVLNNGVKYVLNLQKGLTGERMLRRLRYSIFRRALLTEDPALRARSPTETTHVVTTEVESIGKFMGEVVATPVFQGATLLVYMGFIFAQDPFLGAAAVALYPVQAMVVPMIQARVIARIQERLRNIRAMAQELNEAAEARAEALAYGAAPWHLAQISGRLFANFETRFAIFRLKFLIKFINNFAAQLTPFFFYAYGGYLVIKGEIGFGALVAVLAAYKDLSGPWKALLGYYQTLSDVRARYRMVVAPYALADEGAAQPDAPTPFAGLRLSGLQTADAAAEGALRGVDAEIPATGLTVVVGDEESGRRALLKVLGGRTPLEGGAIEGVGGDFDPGWVAYAALSGTIFRNSLRFNLAYGVLSDPAPCADARSAVMLREARLTGSVAGDMRGSWFGGADGEALDARILAVAAQTGLEDDLYRLGLRMRVDPRLRPDLAAEIVAMRSVAAAQMDLSDRVESWLEDAFNENASLGENLLFHVAAEPDGPPLPAHPQVARALAEDPIAPELIRIGAEVAETLRAIFEDVTKDKALISQFGLFSDAETPLLDQALARLKARGPERLRRAERALLMRIALDYRPARHRLGVLRAKDRIAQTLAARGRMIERLRDAPGLSPLAGDAYVGGLTVADNLLHGKLRLDRAGAWPPLEAQLAQALHETALGEAVKRLGLDAPLDPALATMAQRGRISVARALLSDRPVLILEGYEAADPAQCPELAAAIALAGEKSVILEAESAEQAQRLPEARRIWLTQGRTVERAN